MPYPRGFTPTIKHGHGYSLYPRVGGRDTHIGLPARRALGYRLLSQKFKPFLAVNYSEGPTWFSGMTSEMVTIPTHRLLERPSGDVSQHE